MRKGNPATLPSHLGPEAKLRRRGLVLRSSPRPGGQSKGKRMEARGSGKNGWRPPGWISPRRPQARRSRARASPPEDGPVR